MFRITAVNSDLNASALSMTVSTTSLINGTTGYKMGKFAFIHLSIYSQASIGSTYVVTNINISPLRMYSWMINGQRFYLDTDANGARISNLSTLPSNQYFEADLVIPIV